MTAADGLAGAVWITTAAPIPPAGLRPAYEFRRRFEVSRRAGARLIVTAHGVYEAFLNGVRVGDEELAPGATSYRKTLHVQSHDVGDLLRDGENELRLVVSDGWFRGKCGPRRIADNFGTQIAVVARLDVEGNPLLLTDASWEVSAGSIVSADLMDGQQTDLRRIGEEQWVPVIESADPLTLDTSRLQRSTSPAVRRREIFAPRVIRRLTSGRQIVDFGQNLNGWVRLTVRSPRDTRIELTHGETLGPSGDLDLDNLAYHQGPGLPMIGVGQKDAVISRGVDGDVFEPRHTTHGFRYVAVDGLSDSLVESDIVAVQVRSDLSPIGTFHSGNQRVNDLHRIAVSSWRANTCDIPTDCPQRERWGYTGDFQIFVRSAAFLDDISGFSRKWLRSLADDQHPSGLIPNVAPHCGVPPVDPQRPISFDGAAGWGDAATIVPWELYRQYGDLEALLEAYPMMVAWVDHVAGMAAAQRHPTRVEGSPEPAEHERFLWDSGWQWGEWLEPGVKFDYAADRAVVATAYFSHSAGIVAEAAALHGHTDDMKRFRALSDSAADAWRREFLRPDGSVVPATQANYVRALAFGLIPPALASASAGHLVDLIARNGWRLSTGFLSTGLLLPVLADSGHADVAYRLLSQTEEPSWMTMLERGATTVWEAWDGVDADGVAHDSLNHYSKGAVISFLHEYAAGLRPLEPGYARIGIRPFPHRDLGSAAASLQTRSGRVASAWTWSEQRFSLRVTVPEGATAEVVLPDGAVHDVGAGEYRFDIDFAGEESDWQSVDK